MNPFLPKMIARCMVALTGTMMLSQQSFSQHIMLGNERTKLKQG